MSEPPPPEPPADTQPTGGTATDSDSRVTAVPPATAPVGRGARRQPSAFTVGFAAAIGVGLAFLLYKAVEHARDILVLIALSLFFAFGLDPAVRLVQHRLVRSRPVAVTIVFFGLAAMFTAFGLVVVPPLVDQVTGFVHHLPDYLQHLRHNRTIARLDSHTHLLRRLQTYVEDGNLLSSLYGNVLSAGTAVATTIFEGLTLLVLTLYFMAYLDDIASFTYRMVPRSRRERAQTIGEQITRQVGAYVAGNLLVALIAGLVALVFLELVGAPFPVALAFVVAMLDVVPLIGAASAALIVTVVVLLQSVPAGIVTILFFIAYQVVENYVVLPRLQPAAIRVNPAATIVGALAGFTLLGVTGFLLALPVVATADLLIREVLIPRQSRR